MNPFIKNRWVGWAYNYFLPVLAVTLVLMGAYAMINVGDFLGAANYMSGESKIYVYIGVAMVISVAFILFAVVFVINIMTIMQSCHDRFFHDYKYEGFIGRYIKKLKDKSEDSNA